MARHMASSYHWLVSSHCTDCAQKVQDAMVLQFLYIPKLLKHRLVHVDHALGLALRHRESTAFVGYPVANAMRFPGLVYVGIVLRGDLLQPIGECVAFVVTIDQQCVEHNVGFE